MRKAIFLDRDGVINRAKIINGKPYPPLSIRELDILDGVSEAILKLRNANYLLIVVTNQPDVARGIVTKESVEEINKFIVGKIQIDEIKTCYHDDDAKCNCRKPLPGMILEAASIYDIDLKESYMIGDRWRDVEAGKRAGCKTIFIDYGYSEKKPKGFHHSATSLLDAQKIILKEK